MTGHGCAVHQAGRGLAVRLFMEETLNSGEMEIMESRDLLSLPISLLVNDTVVWDF